MKLTDKRVAPLTETSFASDQDRKVWSAKIEMASEAFHKAETSMVSCGAREAAIQIIRESRYEDRARELKEMGLSVLALSWSSSHNGFSHADVESESGSVDKSCKVVISQSAEACERLRAYRQAGNFDAVGAMLGYPPCCRNFFENSTKEGYFDPIWQQALNTDRNVKKDGAGYSLRVRGYPECVKFHRYWGVQLCAHLPCSFVCEATRRISGLWMKEMDFNYSGSAHAAFDILLLPGTWHLEEGYAETKTQHFSGIVNSLSTDKPYTIFYEPIK